MIINLDYGHWLADNDLHGQGMCLAQERNIVMFSSDLERDSVIMDAAEMACESADCVSFARKIIEEWSRGMSDSDREYAVTCVFEEWARYKG